MTDLQLGLLVIGALGVVAVIVYNRLQERSARRGAEKSFASRHVDVLLEADERREPTLGGAPAAAAPVTTPKPAEKPAAAASADRRVDYVVRVEGATLAAAKPKWAQLAHRFARRARLEEAGEGKLDAALQMVSRNGAVSEAELLEFRSGVETLAASLGAACAAPEMRDALQAAQELDRACAEVDIQIALHVLGAVEASGEGQPYQVARRADGITLLLDVPRTREVLRSYEAMVQAARQLSAHGGRIVDDNGRPLEEPALSAIGAELQATLARFDRLGIEPGSPLALRLFA